MKQEEEQKLKVKNNDDYLLGYAHGAIMGSFATTFLAENKRPTNEEEDQQARDIVYNRTDQIMRAISRAS
jgi:hypothetical protein